MNIIIAIKREYAKKIFSKEKKFEMRKNAQFNFDDRIFLFEIESKKIIGEIAVDCVISGKKDSVWDAISAYAGVTKEWYDKYFADSDVYAWRISKTKKFNKPLLIENISNALVI